MSKSLLDLIDLQIYEDWQKSLIYEQNRFPDQESDEAVSKRQSVMEKQDRLASAVNTGWAKTTQYLFKELNISDEERALREVPQLPNPLTTGEMNHLPAHAERELAIRLHNTLTRSEAAEPAIWTLCHAVWIHRGMFDRNLSEVFFEGPKANTSEARTRNFLRRTGGLRRVRGNTSPLVDCPISAAWWHYYVACEVSEIAQGEGMALTVETAHNVLRIKEIWENLVTMSLRQVTSVCSPRARAAVITVLERHCTSMPQSVRRAQIQGAIRELARLGHSHSLRHVPWNRLVAAAREGVQNADIDGSMLFDDPDTDTDDLTEPGI